MMGSINSITLVNQERGKILDTIEWIHLKLKTDIKIEFGETEAKLSKILQQ